MNVQQRISNQKAKPERLEARVSAELKMRLQHAADLQGSSLTDFILRSAEKAANEVIQEQCIIKLSAEDSMQFVQTLLNPPMANNKLKKAYARYKKNVSSEM